MCTDGFTDGGTKGSTDTDGDALFVGITSVTSYITEGITDATGGFIGAFTDVLDGS
jgi:hypothetical protein